MGKKDNLILLNALRIFKNTSENVVAYKKFLKLNNIEPTKIINSADFRYIPLMDKSNYLLKYKIKELVPFSKLPPIFSSSSGSSGHPYYWPRGNEQEEKSINLHKIILKNIFKINNKNTLAIICFSMGNWVAGTYTFSALKAIANDKDFNLSIITPGIDKNDAVSVLKNFSKNFDSVVMFGYPPFLMDIVLESKEIGVDFSKMDLYFVFAGENFSEKWREIIFKYANLPNKLNRSVSIYGTADAGALGHENPFTILIRKLASNNIDFCKDLVGYNSFIPTIISYNPIETYFESINGQLVFTNNSGIPLVRYNIKDQGIILTYKEISVIMKKHKLLKYLTKDISKWKNPVVILKGRNDVSVTFYGLNIYPENIKAGLEDSKVSDMVTGKHIIIKDLTNNLIDQKLKIFIELKSNTVLNNNIKKLISDTILENLLKLNTEYRKLYNSIGSKSIPEITLLENGHEQFIIKKSKYNWLSKV